MATTITATKTQVVLQASATQTAGAGNTTSAAYGPTAGLGGLATLEVTNGATGPTVGCTATLQYSDDNSKWLSFPAQLAGVDNSGVYDFPIRVPIGVKYLRTVFGGNTVQNVTIYAEFDEVTNLTT